MQKSLILKGFAGIHKKTVQHRVSAQKHLKIVHMTGLDATSKRPLFSFCHIARGSHRLTLEA